MRLAIFDVDGTLVDSAAIIKAALAAAFAHESVSLPETGRLLSVVGLSLGDAMAELAPDQPPAVHGRLAQSYKQAFWDLRAAGNHPEDLYDGAHALLERLRDDGVTLGIATGKSRRGVAHLIAAHGFDGWFATIQTADDHPSKPDPAMITAALAETGCKSDAAIMIGDTSYDMAMAGAAGVAGAGVAWGNHSRDQLLAAGARTIANNFNELHGHLQELWEERTR
ncbi:MAG: HAD-IA family hydrolase [Alphaproteobacteria bacterium]|nr:HAD-IA family hydrolase [Alphaproteobacteria bacterium]